MPVKLGVLIRFFCFFLLTSLTYGQESASVSRVVGQSKRLIVSHYDTVLQKGESFRIPMDFNDFKAEEKSTWEALLSDKTVHAIDLVYTDFPRGRNFEKLNRNRLIRLQQMLPELFEQQNIRWRYIGQDGCNTLREAEDLFHGFAIYYTPGKKKKVAPEKEPVPPEEETEVLAPVPDPEDVSQFTIADMLEKEYVTPDSLIYRVLERFPDWQEMAVVNDCTGSMYGYNVEVMTWFAQQEQKAPRTKWFTFFNDGDFKPDKKKRIGRTGGVYMIRAKEFKQAKKLMLRTMMSGGGGDTPENDMEALLMTAKVCPDCQEIVLIADSWSKVRDLRLLKKYLRKYNIPIRVILCGAARGVAPEYLTMAYLTGGSVHTIEEDLTTLQETEQQGEVKIGHEVFKLFGSEFVLFKRDAPQDFSEY